MNNELLTAGNLYGSLINDIGNILVEARGKICREINSVMVDAYWNIGKYIVGGIPMLLSLFIQKGQRLRFCLHMAAAADKPGFSLHKFFC